jgi:hypothetical protein
LVPNTSALAKFQHIADFQIAVSVPRMGEIDSLEQIAAET